MDVVVIDIPPAYALLLSRKWSSSVGGTLQMDLSSVMIPNVEGKLVIIPREPYYSVHVEKAYFKLNQALIVEHIPYNSNFMVSHASYSSDYEDDSPLPSSYEWEFERELKAKGKGQAFPFTHSRLEEGSCSSSPHMTLPNTIQPS